LFSTAFGALWTTRKSSTASGCIRETVRELRCIGIAPSVLFDTRWRKRRETAIDDHSVENEDGIAPAAVVGETFGIWIGWALGILTGIDQASDSAFVARTWTLSMAVNWHIGTSGEAFIVILHVVNSTDRRIVLRTDTSSEFAWALPFAINDHSSASSLAVISIGLSIDATDRVVDLYAKATRIRLAGTFAFACHGNPFASRKTLVCVGDFIDPTHFRTTGQTSADNAVAGTFLAACQFNTSTISTTTISVCLSVSTADRIPESSACTQLGIDSPVLGRNEGAEEEEETQQLVHLLKRESIVSVL